MQRKFSRQKEAPGTESSGCSGDWHGDISHSGELPIPCRTLTPTIPLSHTPAAHWGLQRFASPLQELHASYLHTG